MPPSGAEETARTSLSKGRSNSNGAIVVTTVVGLFVVCVPLPVAAQSAAATPADKGATDAAAVQKTASGKTSPEKTSSGKAPTAPAVPAKIQFFDIDEYQIDGADHMAQIDVEEAVYPFLGPHRSSEDVEKARAALEKAYHDKGYQTVNVSIPPQNAERRVVILKVAESVVGRVHVKSARFFDLDKVKEKAPSLQEGALPNFKDLTRDIVSLNQLPDRKVTPALRAGVTPGTVDVDLNVEDKLPLHGSLEVNNRQSPNTVPFRISGTLHYDDLWQLGHSLSFTYQVAPQDPKNAQAFSGSYLARVNDWLSVLVYGLNSQSNVAALGGLNVVGPGQVAGVRAVLTLPGRENFFHTISLGPDYKHFSETLGLGTGAFSSPVTYFPLVASYSATWQQEGALTQLSTNATLNVRGLGSDFSAFDAKRAFANASFVHVNADISHSHDLPEGFQIYGRVQGQAADGPLVSSEQFSLGGWDTVRGYLESEALGDNAITGTAEIRSPDIAPMVRKSLQEAWKDDAGKPLQSNVFNEWRFFGFADGGVVAIDHALVEQQGDFWLASYGVGTRLKAFDYFNAQLALAMPIISQTYTRAEDPHVLFRVWGEF